MDTFSSLRLLNRSIDCVDKIAIRMIQKDYPVDLFVMREVLKEAHGKMMRLSDVETMCYYELENSRDHWTESVSVKGMSHQHNFLSISMNNAAFLAVVKPGALKSVAVKRTLHRLADYLADDDYCHPQFNSFLEETVSTTMALLRHTHFFSLVTDPMGQMTFTAADSDGLNSLHIVSRSIANVVAQDYEVHMQAQSLGFMNSHYLPRAHH